MNAGAHRKAFPKASEEQDSRGGKEAINVSVQERKPAHLNRRWAETAIGVVLGGVLLVLATVALTGTSRRAGASTSASISLQSPRVVLLKARRVLHLFDGETLVRSYPVDLGTAPIGQKRLRGDGRTPTGEFRVVTKNPESRYFRFIGIDYPNEEAVEWGVRHGLVSPGEAASIRAALNRGRCPDWGTDLGGGLGIHGHRKGRDWTAGCVALSNEHVDELFSVLRIGDPVEILP
jgi:lipoprotein-anchoring transpeptidase ErfK/SrfK